MDRFDIGGMETVALNLITRTREHYTHRVLCLRDVGALAARLEAAGVPVETVGKRPGKDIGAYIRLYRRLRVLRPDIVHTYNIGAIEVAFWARLSGTRRVIHAEHGRDAADPTGTNRKYRWLRKALAPMIDSFVAVSADLADWLTNSVGVGKAKIRLIRNGIDTDRFRPIEEGKDAIDGKTLRIGSVGRLDRVKDFETLIDAFAQLREMMPERRMQLFILGDGPERAALTRRIDETELKDQVILAGVRDDVEQMLRTFDIYICSSIAEGVALTILEAMATGLPVVATDVGGNPELVVEGETGLLVPAGQPSQLADAIRKLAGMPGRARALGQAGCARVRAGFSLETMTLGYCQLYDELLEH